MKEVSLEQLSSTEYKISLNIPADKVDKKFDQFFESVKKEAQVPGFRKGKAPVSRLKQIYGSQSKPTVAQMIINEYYTKAIQESGITPIGNPKIDGEPQNPKYHGKFGFDNSYSIDLIAEILPNIDPVGYKEMDLDFEEILDDDVYENKMMEYREQFAEKKQVNDRAIKNGDTLIVDFTGYVDGKAFDGGSASGHTMESYGKANFIPGFEDGMKGMKPGETRRIKVKFPEKYHAEHLANKDAEFDITIHSIIETKLADIDDDLALMSGFENTDELKAHIKKEADEEIKLKIRAQLDNQITKKLLEANEFDAPKSMVDTEMFRLVKLTNRKFNELPDKAKQALKESAERSVKRALLIDAIYEKENDIEISPEELNKLLEEHAKQGNISKDELVSNLYNSNQMDNFVGILRVSKVIDFIIDNTKKGEDNE